ncbi:MAG: hypothetical protein BYD32DRAFT_464400 [Podila humilis]|nr:MAG: hypothetical protein BYD32DRAFT_464400 [Podila humilis]
MVMLDRIKKSQPSRIINVSAMGHEFVSGMDIETISDLSSVEKPSPTLHLTWPATVEANSAACLTQVYCATSPKIVNKDIRGRHFIPIANELQPNPTAEDVEAQEALWAYYEKLIQDKAPLRNKRI